MLLSSIRKPVREVAADCLDSVGGLWVSRFFNREYQTPVTGSSTEWCR